MTGRRRSEKLRSLNRFKVGKAYEIASGGPDYSKPVYRVRPRGFSTTLIEVRRPAHVHEDDFTAFMEAVRDLCDIPAPEKRVRR